MTNDRGFFNDCAAFQRELEALSVSEYIAVLRKSEKCGYGPNAHLYHESFAELPSFSNPHGKKARNPCMEAAIGIVRVKEARAKLT